MTLIRSHRHSPADLRTWERRELGDRLYAMAHRRRLDALVEQARRAIDEFLGRGPAYVSVSWGKDSTVLAHLSEGRARLAYLRVEPTDNPDTVLVRDEFLRRYPQSYHEELLTIPCTNGEWDTDGAVERGFPRMARALGASRYILGIRAQESQSRYVRIARGLSVETSCAPLGRWTIADVFAYLWLHDLPIHPAYACSFDGRLSRENIRVAWLGMPRGRGFGRAEWERRYYGEEIDAIDRASERD